MGLITVIKLTPVMEGRLIGKLNARLRWFSNMSDARAMCTANGWSMGQLAQYMYESAQQLPVVRSCARPFKIPPRRPSRTMSFDEYVEQYISNCL